MGFSSYEALVTTDLLVRIKSKASQRIIGSTISAPGSLFAYSEHVKPSLFELKSAHGKETMDLLITKTGIEMEKDSIVVEKDRKLERE